MQQSTIQPDTLIMPAAISPATGEPLTPIAATPAHDLAAMMDTARRAAWRWDQLGLRHRLRYFRRLKAVMYQQRTALVNLIMTENGKVAADALTAEIWATLEAISFYLRQADRILKPRGVFSYIFPHRFHRIERRAHGVVLIISPWNFPVYLAMPPMIAALVAGNSVLFKPSEFAPRVGQKLAELFWAAGFPRDVVQVVQGTGEIGAALIALKPDKICFTGSVATGRKVAQAAGALLIPVTLELGGKDAAIVLADAHVQRAANGIAWAAMHNAGQACASIERVYVEKTILPAFSAALVSVIQRHVTVGASMGAITTDAQLQIIDTHVREAVASGGQVLIGGKRADRPGRYYEPTVIGNLDGTEKIASIETFGPVIALIACDSADHAVQLANDSPYGLTGSIWTRDTRTGLALARRLQCGLVSLNDHLMDVSTPSLPWGGRKDSGYGRTRGDEGLLEMTVTQMISGERLPGLLSTEIAWYPYSEGKMTLIKRVMGVLYAPTARAKWHALTAPIRVVDTE